MTQSHPGDDGLTSKMVAIEQELLNHAVELWAAAADARRLTALAASVAIRVEREQALARKERRLAKLRLDRAEAGDRNEALHRRTANLHLKAAEMHEQTADRLERIADLQGLRRV